MRKLLTIATLIVIVLAAVGGVAWFAWQQRVQRNTFYTDADTIQESLETAWVRDVLWTPAKDLGPSVNSLRDEPGARISADGASLWLVRRNADGTHDIYTAARVGDGWGEPQPVAALNTPFDELGPEPTRDGSAVYFHSDRPGGAGGHDLWVSRRTADGWSEPQNLGARVNSRYHDQHAAVSGDATTLYFTSNRPSASDLEPGASDDFAGTLDGSLTQFDHDLYQLDLTAADAIPAPIDLLNTDADERSPTVTAFGDFIYFASDRPGGLGGFDLYRARRVRGELLTPRNLGDEINSPDDEISAGIDASGFGLFFASDRPYKHSALEGNPDHNLYFSTSREVFRETAQFSWPAIWDAIAPSLLWALLILLVLLMLLAYLRQLEFQRLSLLARCLLASLCVHLIALFLLTLWGVTSSLSDLMQDRDGVRVALITTSGGEGSLSSQIRGELTDVPIAVDAPSPSDRQQRDTPTVEAQTQSTRIEPENVRAVPSTASQTLAEQSQAQDAERAASAQPTVESADVDVRMTEAIDVNTPQVAQPRASGEASSTPASTNASGAETSRTATNTPVADVIARQASVAPEEAQPVAPQPTMIEAPRSEEAPATETAAQFVATSDDLSPTPVETRTDVAAPAATSGMTTAEAQPTVADQSTGEVARSGHDVDTKLPDAPAIAVVADLATPDAVAEAGSLVASTTATDLAPSAPHSPLDEIELAIDSAPDANVSVPTSAPAEPAANTAEAGIQVAADNDSSGTSRQIDRSLILATVDSGRVTADPAATSVNLADAEDSTADGTSLATDASVATPQPSVAADDQPVPVGGVIDDVRLAQEANEPAATVEEPTMTAAMTDNSIAMSRHDVDSDATRLDSSTEITAIVPAATDSEPNDTTLAGMTSIDDATSNQAATTSIDVTALAAPEQQRPVSDAPVNLPHDVRIAENGELDEAASDQLAITPDAAGVATGRRHDNQSALAPMAATVARVDVKPTSSDGSRVTDRGTLADDDSPIEALVAAADRAPDLTGPSLSDIVPAMQLPEADPLDLQEQNPDEATFVVEGRGNPEARTTIGAASAVASERQTTRLEPDSGEGDLVTAAVSDIVDAQPIDGIDNASMTNATDALDAPVIAQMPLASPESEMLDPVDRDSSELWLKALNVPTERTVERNLLPWRAEEQRNTLLRKHGGDDRTEQAVTAALRWLAAHQSEDGRWDGDAFCDAGECNCGGETDAQVDIALTGLALLAFLGADHVHTEDNEYRDTVERGMQWLRKQQTDNGSFLGTGETMYSHGIATIALSEALAMSGDPQLLDHVVRAIEFIGGSANEEAGGWRYAPGQYADTSVTGWQVLAMASAARARVTISPIALDGAARWIESVRHPRRAGRYGYQPNRDFTRAMTAEAMFIRQLLGIPRADDDMRASADFLLDNLPDWEDDPNTYYWYYGTLAMFHYQGPGWELWNDALKAELIAHQRTDGDAAGSWDPVDRWAEIGSRVYQTAIAALCLEVYYRYEPIYSPDDVADAIGTIHGQVTDAVTRAPIAGAQIRLDLPDRPALVRESDSDGNYRMPAPEVAEFFALSASHSGYSPSTTTANIDELRGRNLERNFALERVREDVIALEDRPQVHHLGNDRFEGAINSQFQRESEGLLYRAPFEINADQMPPRRNRAEIRMLVKGAQAENRIRINGRLLNERLNDSPANGDYGEFIAEISTDLLVEGRNALTIESVRGSTGDIDDFEFVNVRIYLYDN